jgi:hypothetical protein
MDTNSDLASQFAKLQPPLGDPALVEALASVEHARWAHWQRYMHEQCTPGEEPGTLVIPAELVTRWARQFRTPYQELPEDERASDREQVLEYLKTIDSLLDLG